MLIGAEGRVEDLGDRDVAKVQGLQRLAVGADIDGLCRFRADRGAALEVDAEVQPHDHAHDDRGDHQRDRAAEGQPLPAEEIDLGVVGDEFETESHVWPLKR